MSNDEVDDLILDNKNGTYVCIACKALGWKWKV